MTHGIIVEHYLITCVNGQGTMKVLWGLYHLMLRRKLNNILSAHFLDEKTGLEQWGILWIVQLRSNRGKLLTTGQSLRGVCVC